MIKQITKRDGRKVAFHIEKIVDAIEKAFKACGAMQDRQVAQDIAEKVVAKAEAGALGGEITVEGIQDLVEETLSQEGFVQTANEIVSRNRRRTNRRFSERLRQLINVKHFVNPPSSVLAYIIE